MRPARMKTRHRLKGKKTTQRWHRKGKPSKVARA